MSTRNRHNKYKIPKNYAIFLHLLDQTETRRGFHATEFGQDQSTMATYFETNQMQGTERRHRGTNLLERVISRRGVCRANLACVHRYMPANIEVIELLQIMKLIENFF